MSAPAGSPERASLTRREPAGRAAIFLLVDALALFLLFGRSS